MKKGTITVADINFQIKNKISNLKDNSSEGPINIDFDNEIIEGDSSCNRINANHPNISIQFSNCSIPTKIVFEHFTSIEFNNEIDVSKVEFINCRKLTLNNIEIENPSDVLALSHIDKVIFNNCTLIHKEQMDIDGANFINFNNCKINIGNIFYIFHSKEILFNRCIFEDLTIHCPARVLKKFSFKNSVNTKGNLKVILSAKLNETSISFFKNHVNTFEFQNTFTIQGQSRKEEKTNIINNFIFEGNDINYFKISCCNFNKLNLLNDPFNAKIGNIHIEGSNFEQLNIRNRDQNKCNILIDSNSKIKNLTTNRNKVSLELNETLIENAKFQFADLLIGPNIITRHNKDSIAISNTCQIELKEKDDIDTINILRYMFKDSNYHEYLQYNALSQNYLLEDKEGKLKCRDKILLWLNKNSNEFGTNWWKGVKFTFISGSLIYIFGILFSYILFCAFFKSEMPIMSFKNWSRTAMGLLEFITSTDLFQSNEKSINTVLKNSNPLTLSFYILGKFSVMYGIYQTIQAFRKYRN